MPDQTAMTSMSLSPNQETQITSSTPPDSLDEFFLGTSLTIPCTFERSTVTSQVTVKLRTYTAPSSRPIFNLKICLPEETSPVTFTQQVLVTLTHTINPSTVGELTNITPSIPLLPPHIFRAESWQDPGLVGDQWYADVYLSIECEGKRKKSVARLTSGLEGHSVVVWESRAMRSLISSE
ncbi:hypothetical protein M231_05351 [Tremella mesenterica]|uniref:Uncharacterized protein n=1 Tax=Tremella mesenterica TaxID=5217 RepID=A0A4Q1BIA6_TREME|nr:hypothetical protein M231_05351 [Tremella mesenterica]